MANLRTRLAADVRSWISRTYDSGSWRGTEDCFRILAHVRLPDRSISDLVSLRHCRSVAPDAPDLYVAGLWNLSTGPADDRAANLMARQLRLFHAWHAELKEPVRCCGSRPDRRFEVRGNIVGASIRRTHPPEILRDWGRGLSFWTWRRDDGGIDLRPYYGGASLVPESRKRLQALLSDLPWKAPAPASPAL